MMSLLWSSEKIAISSTRRTQTSHSPVRHKVEDVRLPLQTTVDLCHFRSHTHNVMFYLSRGIGVLTPY